MFHRLFPAWGIQRHGSFLHRSLFHRGREGDEGERERVYLEFDRASKGERCGWVFWVGATPRDLLCGKYRWLLSKVRERERAELMTFTFEARSQRAKENPKKLYRAWLI